MKLVIPTVLVLALGAASCGGSDDPDMNDAEMPADATDEATDAANDAADDAADAAEDMMPEDG